MLFSPQPRKFLFHVSTLQVDHRDDGDDDGDGGDDDGDDVDNDVDNERLFRVSTP